MFSLYINNKMHMTFKTIGEAWLYATDNYLTEVRRGKAQFKRGIKLKETKHEHEHENPQTNASSTNTR